MAGILASFNPWTVLDNNDPGDVIGKAKSKADAAAAKKPAAAGGRWAPASKAMEASTPAKKKKNNKKPAAAAANQANGKGPAGKQNGAGKGSKNDASGGVKNQQRGYNNGGYGATMREQQRGYNNGGHGAPMREQQLGPAVDEAADAPVEEAATVEPPTPPPSFDNASPFPALGRR